MQLQNTSKYVLLYLKDPRSSIAMISVLKCNFWFSLEVSEPGPQYQSYHYHFCCHIEQIRDLNPQDPPWAKIDLQGLFCHLVRMNEENLSS